MSPTVSVIIPTYNRSYCIKKAIDSVLSQTYKEFELIIIDNYSTDNTEEIISNYKNKKIIYKKFCNNGVIASSRNRGIFFSKSKYIAFLDSDDWWKKDKLRLSIDFLENGYDFICHGLEIIRKNQNHNKSGEYTKYIKKLKPPFFESLLKDGNTIETSSVVVKREIINSLGGFYESNKLSGSEDYDMWLRISSVTDKFYVIKNNLGYLRYGEDNFSKDNKKIKNALPILINRTQKLCIKKRYKPNYLYFLASSTYLNEGELKNFLRFSWLLFKNSSRLIHKIKVILKIPVLFMQLIKRISNFNFKKKV